MLKKHGFAGHVYICQRERQGKRFHIEIEIWTSQFNLAFLTRLATIFATTHLEISLGSGCDCGCGGESNIVIRHASLIDAA